MIDDIELRRRVIDELDWEPMLDATHIAVTAADGAVTLEGHVDSYAELFIARRVVRRIDGVKAVADDLEVRLPSGHERDDGDIAESVAHVLSSSVSAAERDVRAEVRAGVVTLSGTVDWDRQRRHVEEQVAHVAGVRVIHNEVTLRERSRPDDIRSQIRDAFDRSAALEAEHVTVDIEGDVVTLGGTVRAYYERGLAQTAAWAAPGVRRVVDNIQVR